MDDKVREELITSTMPLTLEQIIERLDAIANKYEMLFDESKKFFRGMREQFLKEIIQERVEFEMDKNKRVLGYKKNNKAGWVIHS